MRFNIKAKREIQEIADNLPDYELERIGKEVDANMERHKINPLIAPACQFLTRFFDYPAIEMFDEDDEQHIEAEAFLRDMMVKVARRERAIAIWTSKHSFDEVA
ncbi:hypothetical protein [Pantoea ananatis]|uniref:hypothetical protein n=1 Tax=Pantoea ananas TaxID=553 RepID=UPI001B310381|nr:hypothetical protein [Pantoea ananatis]